MEVGVSGAPRRDSGDSLKESIESTETDVASESEAVEDGDSGAPSEER